MDKIYECERCGSEDFELITNEEGGCTAVCKQCLLVAFKFASRPIVEGSDAEA